MDDMILLSKTNKASGLNSSTSGRPVRTDFCLRIYDKYSTIVIPSHLCEDGDKVDFYISKSKTGFGLKISQDAERLISKNHTGRTVMVPKEIVNCIPKTQNGIDKLVFEERPDRFWFFPFDQFLTS